MFLTASPLFSLDQVRKKDPVFQPESKRRGGDRTVQQRHVFFYIRHPAGRLAEVTDRTDGRRVRQKFVNMITANELSSNVVAALGHSPDEPLEAIVNENRSLSGNSKA